MKKFWKFGLLAVTAAAFVACGDDSSSNASEGESSSSGAPIVLSSASAESPITFSNMDGVVSSNGAGGEQLALSGNIKIDNTMMPNKYIDENGDEQEVFYLIDSVSFIAGHVEGGQVLSAPISVVLNNVTYPAERLNLSSTAPKINLDEVEGCGDFRMYIWVYSSEEHAAGAKVQYATSAVDSLSFTKQCKTGPVESSSSIAAPSNCTEVTAAKLTLSNVGALDQSGLNMATGTGDAPDITISFVNGVAYLKASEGVKIFEEKNQNFFGEGEKVCKEDFATMGAGKQSVEIESFSWYIVETAQGQTPIQVGKAASQDKSSGSVEVTYYK